jgi:hypothetical protein
MIEDNSAKSTQVETESRQNLLNYLPNPIGDQMSEMKFKRPATAKTELYPPSADLFCTSGTSPSREAETEQSGQNLPSNPTQTTTTEARARTREATPEEYCAIRNAQKLFRQKRVDDRGIVQCIDCGCVYKVAVTDAVLRAWDGSNLGQLAPHLSAADRELLISGICNSCCGPTQKLVMSVDRTEMRMITERMFRERRSGPRHRTDHRVEGPMGDWKEDMETQSASNLVPHSHANIAQDETPIGLGHCEGGASPPRLTRAQRKKAKFDRYVAYHEAGHAVARMVSGIGFSRVTIKPDTPGFHGMTYAKGPDTLTHALAELVISLAGPMAEAGVRPPEYEPFNKNPSDVKDILDCLNHIPVDQHEKLLNEAKGKAEILVKLFWADIEALAGELLVRGTLTEEEAILVCPVAAKVYKVTRALLRHMAEAAEVIQ